MPTILFVEDDPVIREEVAETLRFQGYDVRAAGLGREGAALALEPRARVDLAILDANLPDLDGFDLCRKIKDTKPEIAVIMLTVRGEERDKLLGFEMGADDYLTKPFSLRELLARVRALLRRGGGLAPKPGDAEQLAIGRSLVDFGTFLVRRGSKEWTMTGKECAILRLLAKHGGRVVSREAIIEEVWGGEYEPTTRTIDNFVLRLRQKVEENPESPRHLLTIHGVGYKLVP